MVHHDDAALADVLARPGDDGAKDLFRRLLEQALQQLIDTELTAPGLVPGRAQRPVSSGADAGNTLATNA